MIFPIERLCAAYEPVNNELEALVTGDISRIEFRQCMAASIKKWGQVKEEVEVLDVSMVQTCKKGHQQQGQDRYTVKGKCDIATYCKTNKLVNVASAQTKRLIDRVEVPDYGVKIKLSEEVSVSIPANLSSDIKDALKMFRLKKRFGLLIKESEFRIDFTIVRTGCAKNLATAQLQQEKERYEIEVEYVGNDTPSAATFSSIIEHVLTSIKGDLYLTSAAEKAHIISFYETLINNTTRRLNFIGPKPVTLEHQNMRDVSLEPNTPLLINNYAVTEKADGNRALIVFDSKGDGYLVDNRFTVKKTMLNSIPSSIADVEVVKRADGTMLILAFDCYWLNNVPIYQQDLTERLAQVKTIVEKANKKATTTSAFEFRAKQMRLCSASGSDIFKETKYILDKISGAMFDYNTDGVIFTPVKLGVGETHISGPALGNTWGHVFKWKEPRDNTIDVMVKESETIANVRSFTVYVGTSRATVESYFEKKKNNETFIAVPFRPPGAPMYMNVTLDQGIAKCANGDEIRNNYVVEISYLDQAWKPLRVRHDKIEESNKNGGSITANALPTANSVWRTIKNPITYEQITGKIKVVQDDDPVDEDMSSTYYDKEGYERSKSNLRHMADFHNHWVKNHSLIAKFNGHSSSLFDVSCGIGGDLNKWIMNGFTTVVGVDISEGNIVGQKEGAYHRLIQSSVRIPEFKYVFVAMDSGRPWIPQIDEIKDDYLKKVARVTWGLDPSPTPSIKHLEGIASQPTFGVVSCQFSLHYFFETKEKLEALITNVNSVLKPGGYFIGTCFDGERVVELLTTDEVKSKNDSWAIKRAWTGTHKKTFGQAIDVRIESISQKWNREYLVSFDLLIKMMAKAGIRLLTPDECKAIGIDKSTGTFEELFNDMRDKRDKNSSFNTWQINSALRMDEDERKLSFLNNWFVFIKDFKVKRAASKKVASSSAGSSAKS